MCHNQASHAVPFNTTAHYSVTSVTFPGSCSPCHDVFAPTTKVGPVCQTCHVAASPLEAADCTSCHTSPPDGGAGALYANIAGAHAAHIALNRTGSPVSCDTCHTGLGPSLQNLNHYNRAKSRVSPGDVLFLATYNAQSGSSSFDNSAALSCSNVSCHGGVARSGGNPGTPLNWQTGNLTVNTECTSCHVSGTSQYNSYASGEHPFHVNLFGATATTCSQCHNTTTLALNHFTTLADNSMSPAVASATIGGAGTFITTWVAGAGTSGTCNAQCHPGNRDW
jgi:predicted CxxxxCH...CXXCH cytochrome family protein